MLYSENELNKRLRSGCGLYYFYAADEALVHTAAQKALKVLNEDDPETTVLDGPRSEEHTSELQSQSTNSYDVFCLKKKKKKKKSG